MLGSNELNRVIKRTGSGLFCDFIFLLDFKLDLQMSQPGVWRQASIFDCLGMNRGISYNSGNKLFFIVCTWPFLEYWAHETLGLLFLALLNAMKLSLSFISPIFLSLFVKIANSLLFQQRFWSDIWILVLHEFCQCHKLLRIAWLKFVSIWS